ncbi:MAG TPA: TetR family transcriptional regulator [Kofleriaceae bacterium]
MAGLRERKKAETRRSISDIATRMFAERGFDAVTVAEVAVAAKVSVATIFNYFETKEDLFFDIEGEVIEAHCRAVRERAPGESIAEALHRAFGTAIDAIPRVYVHFVRTLEGSAALRARARVSHDKTEAAVAATIAVEMRAAKTDPTPRIVTTLLLAIEWMLMEDARAAIGRGESFAAVKRQVRRTSDRALALLERGVRDYGRVVS